MPSYSYPIDSRLDGPYTNHCVYLVLSNYSLSSGVELGLGVIRLAMGRVAGGWIGCGGCGVCSARHSTQTIEWMFEFELSKQ